VISSVVQAVANRDRSPHRRRSRVALVPAVVALGALAVSAPRPTRAQATIPITTTATSARAIALAGVGVTPAFDAAAAHTNPAALTGLTTPALALAHRVVAPGVAQQGGVFALPWRGGSAFALGADVYRVDGAPSSDALQPGHDAAYAMRGGLHAALSLPHQFAVGVGVARYASTLAPESVDGWCSDAGLHWRGHGFRAGAALRGWSLGGAAPGDARTWSAGVGRGFDRFDVAAQVDGDRDGTHGTAAAVTWRAASRLEVRAGARHDADAGETFGTGLAVAAGGVQLEWGCRLGRGVRMENVVGLAVAFGSPAPRAGAKAPPQRRRAETKPVPQPAVSSGDRVATPVLPATPPPAPVASPAAPAATNAAQNAPAPAAVAPVATPPPAGAAPSAENTAAPAPRCYSVRGGTHRDLEAATKEIFKLRAADLSVDVERSGEQYIVVVKRCTSHGEATELQARAKRAGVRCTVVAE
jgi:hypothetical protein